MVDNGSPPLSRRVPGTTSMHRAQVRRPPPRLPDAVLERLKAEVQAARAKETEPDPQGPEPSSETPSSDPTRGALPRRSKLTALGKRPTTAPLPEQSRQAPWPEERSAAPLSGPPSAAPLPHRPKVAPRIERPKLAPPVEDLEPAPLPGDPNDRPFADLLWAAPGSRRPRPHWQWTKKTDEPSQQEIEELPVLPDSPQSPVAASDDITEPIPVVVPSGSGDTARPIRELVASQAPPAAPERPRRQVRRSAGPKLAKTQLHKPAAPPRPKRADQQSPKLASPRRRTAATQSTAASQATMLQALFAETTDFEEVVASARAHAGRPFAGIDWRSVFAAAGLAALILVAVIVFMLQLVG